MPSSSADDPRLGFLTVLGLVPPVTIEDVKQAYLEKAKSAHPDRGGNPQDFVKLHEAFEAATEYARFKASRMEWLSHWVEQYAEQSKLIEALQAMGGKVEIKGTDWLTQSVGADFATVLDRLVGIELQGPAINDEVMVQLGTQRRLLAGLKRLALVKTAVTSIGLRQLHGLDALCELNLTDMPVNPESLEALLNDLPGLQKLTLHGTDLGAWARLKLRFAHRGLEISS